MRTLTTILFFSLIFPALVYAQGKEEKSNKKSFPAKNGAKENLKSPTHKRLTKEQIRDRKTRESIKSLVKDLTKIKPGNTSSAIWYAVKNLAKYGKELRKYSDLVLPPLTEALKKFEHYGKTIEDWTAVALPYDFRSIIRLVEILGPKARPAIPLLISILKIHQEKKGKAIEDLMMVDLASKAIGAIGVGKKQSSVLWQFITKIPREDYASDYEEDYVPLAVEGMAKGGDILPFLIGKLKGKDELAQFWAARVLRAMGPEKAKPAREILKKLTLQLLLRKSKNDILLKELSINLGNMGIRQLSAEEKK